MQFQDYLTKLLNKNLLHHRKRNLLNSLKKQKSKQQHKTTSNSNLSPHSFPSSTMLKRSINRNRISFQNKKNKCKRNSSFSLNKFPKLQFQSLSNLYLCKKTLERKFITCKSIEINILIQMLIMATNSKLLWVRKLLFSQGL